MVNLSKVLGTMGTRRVVPGVSDTRVLLGQTLGFDSVWGPAYMRYTEGLLACFEVVNRHGGVHGRKLEVVRLEDRYDPAQAVHNVRRLASDGEVFGLACIGGAAVTEAMLPVLEECELPTVGTFTGSERVRRYSRFLFHTRSGYATEVNKCVQHLGSAGVRRVALVYPDNEFGHGVSALARDGAARCGVELAATVMHPAQQWDAGAIANEIASAHPQAVLLYTAPQTAADVAVAYRATQAHGLPGVWVLSVTSAAKLQELLGAEARRIAVTQVMPSPNSLSSRLAQAHRAAMQESGRTGLSYESVEGYLTGRVIVEGLTRAGRQLTRSGYIAALEGMADVRIEDMHVRYDAQAHHGPSFVEVNIVGRQLAMAA
jgi:branched-chain amino acid transport system substrate-binding protein